MLKTEVGPEKVGCGHELGLSDRGKYREGGLPRNLKRLQLSGRGVVNMGMLSFKSQRGVVRRWLLAAPE